MAFEELKKTKDWPHISLSIKNPITIRVTAFVNMAKHAACQPSRTPVKIAKPNNQKGPPLNGPTEKMMTRRSAYIITIDMTARILNFILDETKRMTPSIQALISASRSPHN